MTYDEKSDFTELLHLRFQLPRTLVHEIGHALQNAIFGDGNRGMLQEVLYKDHGVAEAGHKLEYQLFGSRIHAYSGQRRMMDVQSCPYRCHLGSQRQSAPAFHMIEWPSYSITTTLEQDFHQDVWSGLEMPRHEMIWNISNSFILSLFTDNFWRTSQRIYSPTVLHPLKLASWPFIFIDKGRYMIPMAFRAVEEFVGLRRARIMCSSALSPLSHQPESLVYDWEEALSEICMRWFDEPEEYSLSKAQRKKLRLKKRDSKRKLQAQGFGRTQE